MDTRKLRACPFCSAEPGIMQLDAELWIVNCETCHALGPHPDEKQDQATAIRRWNDPHHGLLTRVETLGGRGRQPL
jgi:hypothetical protein